jgi:hypothetical protein
LAVAARCLLLEEDSFVIFESEELSSLLLEPEEGRRSATGK